MSSSTGAQASVSPSAFKGIVLTLTACALFALLDSATKFSGQVLSMLMVLWVRFLAQALVTSALVFPRLGWCALRTQHPKFQASRALFGVGTSVFAFYCIQNMPLGNFTAIWAASPLAVVVVSAVLFREKVSWQRLALLLVGLLCVMVIVRPERSDQELGWLALLPVALVACGTGYLLLGSRLARLDRPETTQLYSTWLPFVLLTPFLPWFFEPVQGWSLWGAIVAMGVLSGIGHLMLLQAYTHATPAVVSPFLYSQIGFAMVVGWLLFDQQPDAQSLLGMAGIIACGLLSIWMTSKGR